MGRTGWALTRGRAPQGGWTPLHNAAGFGQLEVARALLLAEADITAKDHVSEGGMGGEGQQIRESRNFEGMLTAFWGAPHTYQERTTTFCANS